MHVYSPHTTFTSDFMDRVCTNYMTDTDGPETIMIADVNSLMTDFDIYSIRDFYRGKENPVVPIPFYIARSHYILESRYIFWIPLYFLESRYILAAPGFFDVLLC